MRLDVYRKVGRAAADTAPLTNGEIFGGLLMLADKTTKAGTRYGTLTPNQIEQAAGMGSAAAKAIFNAMITNNVTTPLDQWLALPYQDNAA